MQRGQSGRLLKHMESNIGLSLYVEDMAKELDVTKAQVQNSVAFLRSKGYNIKTVTNGVYQYQPERPKASGKLFELLAETTAGKFVLQDDEGSIYLATKLD